MGKGKPHLLKSRYCEFVPLQNPLTKVGLEDARDVRLLSANQLEHSFQSEFSEYTIFIFNFKYEHVLFSQ